MEIGANDTGAVDMLVSCLVAPATCQLLDSTIEARVAALGVPLTEALREAHRRARQARILVVGYPQILPEADVIQGRCTQLAVLGVTRAAQAIEFVRAKTTEVNAALRASAQAAGAEFVDVENAFAGHEVCTTQEWVFGLVPADLRGSFHPNVTGHRVLARRIAAAVDRRSA